MSIVKNKVFRDSKNGGQLISVSEQVKAIIDTPPMQRLGGIKQMGVAHAVFRGATHTRLSHSIGVFGIAQHIFRQLRERSNQYEAMSTAVIGMDTEDENDFLVATLLHDVGHAPYSHALEYVLRPEGVQDHEDCGIRIINENKPIRDAVANVADIEAVVSYLRKLHPNRALSTLVSGEFDCDRIDYLVRDSENCGVKYGLYDLEWLAHSLTIRWAGHKPSLVLDVPRGFEALKVFLTARRNMYKQVYYHHTIRAIEVNLRAIFRRIRDLRKEGKGEAEIPQIFGFLKRESGRPNLSEFLEIDDSIISYLISHLSKFANDETLRVLCQMFVLRDTLSCIFDSTRPFYKYPEYYRTGRLFLDDSEPQRSLFGDIPALSSIIAELRAECAKHLVRKRLPEDLSRYIVTRDRPPAVVFGLPPDFLCEIGRRVIPLKDAEREFQLGTSLMTPEQFTIDRIYVPRMFEDDLAQTLYGERHA